MDADLRWLTPHDVPAVVEASHLFDGPVRAEWAERFLEQGNHHLCIAYVDAVPAGFVSGVEITHPDKGTEMLLYELGVDERFQRRGLGRALVEALRDRARRRGDVAMWVAVDHDNEPALATYRATDPDELSSTDVVVWDLQKVPRSPG